MVELGGAGHGSVLPSWSGTAGKGRCRAQAGQEKHRSNAAGSLVGVADGTRAAPSGSELAISWDEGGEKGSECRPQCRENERQDTPIRLPYIT